MALLIAVYGRKTLIFDALARYGSYTRSESLSPRDRLTGISGSLFRLITGPPFPRMSKMKRSGLLDAIARVHVSHPPGQKLLISL